MNLALLIKASVLMTAVKYDARDFVGFARWMSILDHQRKWKKALEEERFEEAANAMRYVERQRSKDIR